jgi:hypothetical protein
MNEIIENLDEDKIYQAISDGVQAGIFKIATNNSSMPCADFYDSIQKGVEVALENFTPETTKP